MKILNSSGKKMRALCTGNKEKMSIVDKYLKPECNISNQFSVKELKFLALGNK